VEGFLDDLPAIGCAEEGEKIRHADAGAGQLARPVGDFEPDDGDRFEYIDAGDARFDVGCGSITVDPVKEESSTDGELIAGVAEEGGLGMEGLGHEFAVASFAAVNVELECFLGFRLAESATAIVLESWREGTARGWDSSMDKCGQNRRGAW
jgi:hypothetical protein